MKVKRIFYLLTMFRVEWLKISTGKNCTLAAIVRDNTCIIHSLKETRDNWIWRFSYCTIFPYLSITIVINPTFISWYHFNACIFFSTFDSYSRLWPKSFKITTLRFTRKPYIPSFLYLFIFPNVLFNAHETRQLAKLQYHVISMEEINSKNLVDVRTL